MLCTRVSRSLFGSRITDDGRSWRRIGGTLAAEPAAAQTDPGPERLQLLGRGEPVLAAVVDGGVPRPVLSAHATSS